MNDTKKTEGLPDIADLKSGKSIVLMMMCLMAIIAIAAAFYYQRDQRHNIKSVEDTYSIANEPLIQPNPVTVESKSPSETVANKEQSEGLLQAQIALMQEKEKALRDRLAAPLMLVNANLNQGSANSSSASSLQSPSANANTQFMHDVSSQNTDVIKPTSIAPLNAVIAEGSLIHAVMESATNSDLPGYLRASVSEPVYAEDGSQVLIPRGTRLIGQYKSGMLQGQSRIFIVWTRLITPQGISLQLGSPGVDSLGVAGMKADEVNRHFWERFGNASLLSLIGAGAANLGVSDEMTGNSVAQYRSAVASSFAQTAEQSLQKDSMIAPTLKSYQGKPIMVFVARDLDFQNSVHQAQSKINVF